MAIPSLNFKHAYHWLIPPKASGVYVIRENLTGFISYVGESHTGRLRKTMRRHFQRWRPGAGQGPTFSPGSYFVAIVETPPGEAIALQDQLIRAKNPIENTIGLPENEPLI